MTERAEELGQEDDSIPLTRTRQESNADETSTEEFRDASAPDTNETDQVISSPPLARDLQAPLRAQDPSRIKGTGGPPVASTAGTAAVASLVRQDPPALTRAQKWAATASTNLDLITYSVLTIFVGLPVYYAAGYAMPVQLGVNVIFYLLALRTSPRYKTFLHPVLVSSAFTILAIWVLALVRHNILDDGLQAYSTGTKYTQLWDMAQNLSPPGAGDVFSSVLDVSIVALGLPMFQYRNELKARFAAIIIPNVSLSIGSLLGYPAFCHAIGISPPRSLAFASRSLTLALATPATTNLGGDLFTVAPLCIFSGIVGVVVGPWALKKLRIPEGTCFAIMAARLR